MGLILFDYKSCYSFKLIISSSLSVTCLFDGYLTESTSYPHFSRLAYLTTDKKNATEDNQSPLLSGRSLFDGYLTDPNFSPF